MLTLALDTATADTVVGLLDDGGDPAHPVRTRRRGPGEDGRPRHAGTVLALAAELLGDAGRTWGEVDRIGVGVGPGTFTGLRIGVASARALAQATGAELAPVSTLAALAAGAAATLGGGRGGVPVLACLDARRGEAFTAAWRDGEPLLAPAATPPAGLAALVAGLGPGTVAVGDGAVRFREQLEAADALVPDDGSLLHRVAAEALCALARTAATVPRDELEPDYVRAPDAVPTAQRGPARA